MTTETTTRQPSQADVAVYESSAAGFVALRTALGLPQTDSYSKKLGQDTLAKLRSDMANDKPPMTPLIDLMLARVANAGLSAQGIDPNSPQGKQQAQAFVSDPKQREGMQALIGEAPKFMAVLDRVADANAAPAAPAASASTSAPPAPPKEAVQKVEVALKSLGIDVGQVDGIADEKFHQATTNLKNIIASVAGVQVDAGRCTTADCDKLLSGINTFLGSQQYKDLQAIRAGNAPASLSFGDKILLEGALMTMGEAARIEFALKEKAKTDPKLAADLAKIPPQILKNMPAVLDTLATQKDGLVSSLKTIYTPAAAPAKPAGAAPAATIPLPPPPASTAPASATTTDPVPAAAPTAPVVLTPEQDQKRTDSAVAFVEQVLHDKIGTAIGDLSKKFGGMFGINASQFLPIIGEDDLKDGKGVFGQKSQDMTAAVIMLLKDMNGDKKANGVYNEKIGEELRFAILTKPEFELIRSKLEIEQYSVEDARKLMKGEKANATKEEKEESERLKTAGAMQLKILFDNLNVLKEKKKLDDERAQQTTKYNMMLDGLSVGLDKWAPGVKAWLKDFFTNPNNQIGQMIGGVLSMFGINVGRLWGEKDGAAAVDRAKPAIEKGFETYLNAQAKELNLDVNKDFAKVMESTRAKMMNDLDNNWKFKYSMKLLFGNAEQDVIKNAVQKALDEAAKQTTPDAAKKAFSNYLAEAGKQYQAGNDIDFDKISRLLAEAQTTAGEAANNPEFLEWQRLQQGQPAVTPAPATTPAPAVTPAPTTAAETPVPSPATPVAPASGATAAGQQRDTTTVVSGDGVQAGDQKTIKIGYVEDPTVYKQKLIESNGRVRSLLEVINGNSEKLGMSLPMSMIKEGNGQVVDRATKPASAVIQELLVRAQIEGMKPGEKVDVAKLDKRLTESNLDTVKAYLTIKGVPEADIKKFDDAARSLAKDGALAVSFVGKLQLSMTQLRQIIPEANQSPEVSGAPAAPVKPVEPSPAKEEPPPVVAAPPAAEAPKEGVKVNPEDDRFYEKYVALNKEKGEAHCAPLVFLGRRDEAGKIVTPEDDKAARKTNGADGKPLVYEAYAGVVLNNRDADKTNDMFKIYEMKGVVASTLLNPVDPAYKALRENYIWKDMLVDENDKSKGLKSKAEIDALADKSPNAIDTYIRDTLCIGPQSIKIDVRTSAAPASDSSLTTTFTEAKAAARPYPRLYQELLLDKTETFRISQVEAESLDGGKLNLNALYKQIHSNQYNHEYAQFAEGPYMITVLRNEEDQKEHGGDIAVSRMVQGVMVHTVLDSKRDNIRHPDEYLGKPARELISDFGRREHAFRTGKGDAPAGLDEFLDRGLEGMSKDSNGRSVRRNLNDYRGTSFLEMMIVTGPEENGAYYPPKNAFNTLFGADGDWRARKDYATVFEGRAQQRVVREAGVAEGVYPELDRKPNQKEWNPRYMSDASSSLSDKFGEPVALAAVSDDKFGQNAGDMGLYEVDPAVLDGAGGPALRGRTPSYTANA